MNAVNICGSVAACHCAATQIGEKVKLLEAFTAVLTTHTETELHAAVLRFCHRLEFERMTACAVIDHPGREPTFRCVDNTPAAYRDAFANASNGRRDPVMQHAKLSTQPIVWDQETYVAAGCADKWESQAYYGYGTGIALALHLPYGRHFSVGFDRDQRLPRRQATVTRRVADMQLFAVLAHEVAFRILCPEHIVVESAEPRLTGRELEVLRWTMEGKTAWELGNILGISEQTAARHVHNATRKLECINKLQAVLKAIRSG
jgi:DNA-binding CsgD family transcriptional regulator